MPESVMFHDGNRRLQDQFDSRRIADRLEEKLTHQAFTDADRAFIERSMFFFLATADAQGKPDCSFKGGTPGFVRTIACRNVAPRLVTTRSSIPSGTHSPAPRGNSVPAGITPITV